MDIFISYAHQDKPIAEKFARALENKWSVFWDPQIPAGQTWREVIGDNLAAASCVVVLWSKASAESNWVQDEAEVGKERRILVPVLIEQKVLPPLGFRSIQAADLSSWSGNPDDAAFQKLVADIGALTAATSTATQQADAQRIQQVLLLRQQFRSRYTLLGLTAGGGLAAGIGIFLLRAVLNLTVMDLEGFAISIAFAFGLSAAILGGALAFGIALADQIWKAANQRTSNRWAWIRIFRHRGVLITILGALFFAVAHTLMGMMTSFSESRTEVFNSIPAALGAGLALSIALFDQPYAGWRVRVGSWLWRLALVAGTWAAVQLPFSFKRIKGSGLTLVGVYEFYRDNFAFFGWLPRGKAIPSYLAEADAAVVGVMLFIGLLFGIAKASDLLTRWLKLIQFQD
jgi:hypothetical protein